MRVFKEFNNHAGAKCPICNTTEKKETGLIGINGTQDGHNIEAKQFHLDCLDLLYDEKQRIICQVIKEI